MKVIRAPSEHQGTKKAVSTSYVFRFLFLVPLFVWLFAHSSSLILTSLKSIKCHLTACPCLLLSSIAVLRVVVLSEGEG